MRVALFISCLFDHFHPRAGIATVELLERLGCRVVFPAGQTCCGQAMFNNGFEEEARRLARRMIRVFEPFEHVVTPSGSCAAMVRQHFPGLFAAEPEWRARAASLAARTHDLVGFLDLLRFERDTSIRLRWEGSATYHYSCHLRGLSIAPGDVARLLRGVEGLDYRPLEDVEQCCGFGGLFAVKMPWISGPLGREKVQALRATGAEAVVCNDAGCAMHLEGACRRAGLELRFLHVAELLAEAAGLAPRPERNAAGARA